MANFGTYFLRGFQPSFARTFDTSYTYELQRQQEELKRQRQEEEARKQAGILQQLIEGGVTMNKILPPKLQGNTFVPQGVGTEFKPYSQQKITDLLSSASDDTLQRYNFLKDIKKSKEDKYSEPIFKGKNIYLYNKTKNRLEDTKQTNPFYKEEEPKETYIGDVSWGDKYKQLKGYENPNADPKSETTYTDKNGKKYTITDYTVHDKFEKRTKEDGDSYYKISDPLRGSLVSRAKEQADLYAIVKAGFGEVKTKDHNGNEITYSQKLINHNKEYNSFVDNALSPTAREWYKNEYNLVKDGKQKGNPHPEDYYRDLQEDFIAGKLGHDPNQKDSYDVADLQLLTEKGRTIYGYVPYELENLIKSAK